MKDIPLHTEQDRASVIGHIERLNLDKPWVVTVKRRAQKRSLSQNALYWKWMEQAGQELGYDRNDMDDVCKEACDCPSKNIVIDGITYSRRTTSGLSKKEMAEYMDRVFRKLAGDMGIYLTLPEEQHLRGAA